MTNIRNSAHRTNPFRKLRIWWLVVVALAFTAGAPSSERVLEAQGRPDLELLHQRLLPVFELAGVVFTDADETSGRLTVGVVDRGIEGLLRASLRGLGVAPQTVTVVQAEPIYQVATLRDSLRPVAAGVQIRYSNYVCSLGFNAVRAGVSGFVTASHCSVSQGAVDGTAYYQPANQVSAEFIGAEIADPAYRRNIAGCPRGRVCRYSDSNFVDGVDDPTTFRMGAIAKTTGPNNGSLEIDGDFAISGEGTAAVGEIANKVGRTTGWGQGVVTRTCTNTAVAGTNIVLLCQSFVENNAAQIVAGGDSGSPVFKLDPGASASVTLLGNLWGGNSPGTLLVYSPMSGIEKELGSLETR